MESIDLDMNDLFEQDAGTLEEEIDGDLNPLSGNAAFPDLETGEVPGGSDGEGGNDAAENEDEEGAQLNRLRDLSKGAAKKKVQRPQPKLDSTRLKGDRGLPILMKVFQDVKFKGRGSEAQDLKLMMGKLEHWAHRLFPKVPFDEFIERLEKLGAKKDVQNCVRRIRLDMPILNEDYVTQYDDEEETKKDGDAEEEEAAAAAAAAGGEEDEMDAEQAFEEMMQREHELYCKEKEKLEKETGVSSSNRQRDEEEDDDDDSGSGSQSQSAPPQTPPGTAPPKPSKTPGSMSAEQKARMEENKMKALQKRAARLGVPVSQLMSPKPALPKEKEASKDSSQPRSPLNSCDLEDASQPIQEEEAVATSRLQPGAASSTADKDNVESTSQGVESEKSAASLEDDQQTEEDLMLALEMDTDESFTKDSHSDTGGKSPRVSSSSRSRSQTLTKDGHKETSSERTESQQNGVDSEDMSEEFSLITNKKDTTKVNGENKNSADLMSEEFSVIRGKKPATKLLQNHNELLSEDMETEELSEVLQVVNNNVGKASKDKVQQNGDSEVDMEQVDSLTNMDSDSVPLI